MGKYINTLSFMNICLFIVSINLKDRDLGFLLSVRTFSLLIFPFWDNDFLLGYVIMPCGG